MSLPQFPEASDPAYGLSWGLFPVRDSVHVVPMNDVRLHVRDDCWCRPLLDDSELLYQYTHNSADGRETHEQGRKPS